MMKYFKAFLMIAPFVFFPLFLRGDASIYPLGVTIYKPDKCWNGFTILSSDEGRLVDMNGNLVHLWKGPLHHPNKVYPVGYYMPGQNSLDISQGTLLALAHYNVRNDKINKEARLVDDVVYEIDMAAGAIIWTWKASEHLEEMGFDEAAVAAMQNYKGEFKGEGDGFDWFHQNCVSYLGPNKWFDQGDRRFHPDNIILDSREAGLLAIVDRRSGKIVWRTGPYYREGDDKKLGWIIGPHHTHMIPRGLPGEGNILLFDNGGQSGYGPPNDSAPNGIGVMRRAHSRALEFNPLTKEIVWEYAPNAGGAADPKAGFDLYSPFISSAQRLPNGNTLVTEGAEGRVIEVTKDREVVWEYISPYLWDAGMPAIRNLVYRAYRIPYDWVPQLPKPKESAVDPGPNYLRVVPAEDGSLPDFGADRTPVWKQGYPE